MYIWMFPENYDDIPDWWHEFTNYCYEESIKTKWQFMSVIRFELRNAGIKLITSKKRSWYLRCGTEAELSTFIFKWV